MKATIFPFQSRGTIVIPPSKSMSHRAIICAALSSGESTVRNIAWSEDILVTMEGMRKLGAQIQTFNDYAIIRGIGHIHKLSDTSIFCNESGSTLRFFIPLFSLCDQAITFTGKGRLMKRPQTVFQEIFENQGLGFQADDDSLTITGALKAGSYTVRGDISSQFISGLLFTLPMVHGDSTIHISTPFESRSYIHLTVEMLKRFDINIRWLDDFTLFIPGNQQYTACDYTIEGDYSQFAFFAVLAAINHDLSITGVDSQSKQGDKAVLDILHRCGVKVEPIAHGHVVHTDSIHDVTIDLQDCPDLGPILMVLGMYAKGTVHIINAGRLRIKESDRIEAMETELKKCGVHIHSTEDTVTIQGQSNYTGGITFHAHNDHRIVMALSVASSLMKYPCTIEGAQAVRKSYPSFFDDLTKVGAKVVCTDDE